MLSDLVIDLAILGANGISVKHGLTTPDPAVCAVKSKAVEVSRRRFFTGVSTKFGVTSFCRFADVAEFEVLITDTGLSSHDAARVPGAGTPPHPGLSRLPTVMRDTAAQSCRDR